MTPYIESLLKEADDYVARGYYTSPERYAAALREQAREIERLKAKAAQWERIAVEYAVDAAMSAGEKP